MNLSSKIGITILLLGLLVTLFLVNYLPKISITLRNPEAAALVNFPKDYNSHPNFKFEWWYTNLLVRADDKKDLAYVVSFSRIMGKNYLLSSRYDNSTSSFSNRTDSSGKITTYLKNQKYLFVKYENGPTSMILQEMPTGSDRKRIYKLTGKTDQIGTFDLSLKERTAPPSGLTKPLLWGGTDKNCLGKISVFAPDDTFYYSIPDLDISGKITDLDGSIKTVEVGKMWIDHQWFNSTPPEDWNGHYWTNFHFTESNNLYDSSPHHAVGYVTQIYDSGPKYSYWVKRNPNGYNQCGETGNLSVDNYGDSGYPSEWKLDLSNSNTNFLSTSGQTFSNNQLFTPPIGPVFTESASYFKGTIFGRNFTGLGFFETHLTKPL